MFCVWYHHLLQIKNDPTIAAYLVEVSDSKNDDGHGSSGSQKKHSGKRKSDGMKDAEDRETKSRKTCQPEGEIVHGSKGERESEGDEGGYRNLRPRRSKTQNPDLNLKGESEDS